MTLLHTYTAKKLEPFVNPEAARMESVKLDVSLSLVKGTILAEKVGVNEITKLTITGGPTGGTFTITPNGLVATANIPYNASPAEVQAALEALAGIKAGDVFCYGGALPGGSIFIEWRGQFAATNITPPATTDSLTGGSSPATAIATERGGAAGSPGTWIAYNETLTNGGQFAKRILVYDTATDADGNHVLGQTSVAEDGEYLPAAPAYYAGHFKKADLTGFTETARAQLAAVGIFIHD